MPNVNTTIGMVLVLLLVILPGNAGAGGDSHWKGDLVGSVRKIHRLQEDVSGIGQGGALLIESALSDGTLVEVAVTVTRQSHLTRRTSQGSQGISFKELAEGQKVEVKFDGPVLMSYPLQAQAATIAILP